LLVETSSGSRAQRQSKRCVPEVRWTRNALGYALELSRKNRARILAQVPRLAEFPELGTALAGPYEGNAGWSSADSTPSTSTLARPMIRIVFIVFSGRR